jgi:hypothetical protein
MCILVSKFWPLDISALNMPCVSLLTGFQARIVAGDSDKPTPCPDKFVAIIAESAKLIPGAWVYVV